MIKHTNIKYQYISVISGNPIKLRDVILAENLVIKDSSKEGYTSWCKFKKDYLNYSIKHNKSLKGYNGKCYSEWLPIDIDNTDLSDSLIKCRELIDRLVIEHKVPLKSLKIHFSGSKGFHIEVPTLLFGDIEPSSNYPYIVKEVFRKIGLSNIDTTIYNRNALWRIPNTINSKSKLYKIPLTVDELRNLSIAKIKELAKTPRELNESPPSGGESISELKEVWNSSSAIIEDKYRSNSNTNTPQITNYTKNEYSGVKKGNRNKRAFQIARELKSSGKTLNEAKDYIVKIWNPKNNPPVSNIRSLKRTVESAYSYNHYDSGSIGITKHLRNDPYYNDLNNEQKIVYVYLLTHINEEEKTVWNKYICKPNQIITSINSLSEKTNVTSKKIKTLLSKLEESGKISIERIKEGNRDICSRITFHCIDLSNKRSHQIPSTNTKKGQTDGKLLTSINKDNIINTNNELLDEYICVTKSLINDYSRLNKSITNINNNKNWLIGINEISNYLGEGQTKVSELIKSKKLKSYRVGRKIKVRTSDADSFNMFEKPFHKLTRPQKAIVNCNE